MKKILSYFIAAAALVTVSASCEKDRSYEDNSPLQVNNFELRGANNGTWKLTSIDGQTVPDGLFQYVIFDTAEMTFEFLQNLDSQESVSLTGTYKVEYDEDEGTILSGDYDHASGPWANEYIITEITQETMTWTVRGDSDSYYVYTTCQKIPDNVYPDVKSM